MVGETKEEIEQRWESYLDGYGWYAKAGVDEVNQVDGYKIIIEEIKD